MSLAISAGQAVRPARRAQTRELGVAVVGCGLIGTRRAHVAAAHADTRICAVADIERSRAERIAHALTPGSCAAEVAWRHVVEREDVDIVVASTSNGSLAEVVIAALEAGKHVLMEKPMGRSLAEARCIAQAAAASAGKLQVGFNHRLHPGIRRAAGLVRGGAIGPLISIRARYGHGGRPGLEHEWRSSVDEAGGGELLDQGSHIADLVHWLAGMPATAYALTRTAAWRIDPLDDNAYGLLTFDDGVVAQLHVSMTQWKNLFSFEVHGQTGAVVVEGLGGSYGTERLTHVERAVRGGVPTMHEECFDGDDLSWSLEWDAFVSAILDDRATVPGAADGVAAMRIIHALYRSAEAHAPVAV
jgi:predicted dehydrogenase